MSIISYTITHKANPCIEKEFLSIKQIVNFIAKQYNIPPYLKTRIVMDTIKLYTSYPLRGLASCLYQEIAKCIPINNVVSTNIVMKAIHKYQPNNIYKQFENYLKKKGCWDTYQQGLFTRNHPHVNHAFCYCAITYIVTQSLRWYGTKEGYEFWNDVDAIWEELAFAKKPSNKHIGELIEFIKKYDE